MQAHATQCNLDDLGPRVETASCWRLPQAQVWRLRLPEHYLVLIESGALAGVTPVFRAKSGDLLCYPPSKGMILRAVETTVIYQIIVCLAPGRKRRERLGLREFGPLPQRVSLGSRFQEARGLFESICLELPQPGVVHRLRTQAAVYGLLALVAAAARKPTGPPQQQDAWQRARQRIAAAPEQPIQIARLARELSISAEHFSRQFRQRFGMSPKYYHMDVRIREAAHRLRDPARSLKSVAYELGFADAKSLARVIKRHFAIRVADLRRLPEQNAGERAEKVIPLNYAIFPPGRDWEWAAKHVVDF